MIISDLIYFVMLTHSRNAHVNTGALKRKSYKGSIILRFERPTIIRERVTKVIEELKEFQDQVFSEIAIIE